MWQEIISNKETHEDPVVDASLKIKGKRQTGHGQLSGEVLKTWRGSKHLFLRFSLLWSLLAQTFIRQHIQSYNLCKIKNVFID